MVVLKNGPVGESWEWSSDVKTGALAHMIWWYEKSSQEVSMVFGERGLLRVVGKLS